IRSHQPGTGAPPCDSIRSIISSSEIGPRQVYVTASDSGTRRVSQRRGYSRRVGGFVIEPGGSHLDGGLPRLIEEAELEGIRNVRAVVDRWADGTERFDQPGEMVLVAVGGGEPIGVGGLTRCPDVPGALRVRRFYVSPGWRRRGVARALAS